MGELGLAVLTGSKGVDPGDATAVNPSAWTNAAAAGWGGDRWQLYRSPAAPTKSLMVLATIWDTAADAAEFDAALHLPASCATTRRADAVAILCSGLSGSLETTLGSGATAAVTARVLAATARASDPK